MQYKITIHTICFVVICAVGISLTGCQSVKPYQRAFLNDENMQTSKQPLEKFSSNVHTYREGASGGGRGKTSGGCGCN